MKPIYDSHYLIKAALNTFSVTTYQSKPNEKPDLNDFFFCLPQINLPQVVWTNKLTVNQHFNTSCQLPFLLLSRFHPLAASGDSSRFYQQDICASSPNLPFLAFSSSSIAFFSFLFLLSFLLSQVCRHRIRARICIGFRDCWDSSPPPPPPHLHSYFSCSLFPPLLLSSVALLLLWDDWQRNWKKKKNAQTAVLLL